MKRRSLGVAALLLALAASTSAAQPDAGKPSQAVAPGPAHRRAIELLNALAEGDPATLGDYLKANAAPDYLKRDPVSRLMWERFMMGGKPVLQSFRQESARSVVAVVRNPVTERWNSFFVAVEAAPPHRIVRAALDPFTVAPETHRPAVPPSEARRMARIDRYARKLARAGRFSGVVLVARDDKIILEKAYGLADRSFGAPNTIDTKFNVGSIDKVFTAIAVAQLVEQGRLSYEDQLSKFVDFPDRETAGKIKLKHLLSHTSGLGDYTEPPYDEMRSALYSLDDYMRLLDKQKPVKLDFEPGKGWSYSNTGMLLAGRIIEKVTGEDYYDHIQRTVFDKAGMSTATDLQLDEITPNVATLYGISFPNGRMRWRNSTSELPARSAPDGGSVLAGRDLVKLAAAIRAGRIVKPETFALMAAPKNELGAKGRYGFGIMNMNQRLGAEGRDVIGHGGDFNGSCASFVMVRDAAVPYTLVVLANSFMGSCFPVGETMLEMIPQVRKDAR